MNQIFPAWLVGTIGAILILAATGINSLVVPNLDTGVHEQERQIAKLDSEARNLWSSHTRADDHESAAKRQLTACSAMDGSSLSSCLVNVQELYWMA